MHGGGGFARPCRLRRWWRKRSAPHTRAPDRARAGSDAYACAYTDSHAYTHSDAYTDSHAYTHSDAYADACTHSAAYADAYADAYAPTPAFIDRQLQHGGVSTFEWRGGGRRDRRV